jgi:hypothetical protein
MAMATASIHRQSAFQHPFSMLDADEQFTAGTIDQTSASRGGMGTSIWTDHNLSGAVAIECRFHPEVQQQFRHEASV